MTDTAGTVVVWQLKSSIFINLWFKDATTFRKGAAFSVNSVFKSCVLKAKQLKEACMSRSSSFWTLNREDSNTPAAVSTHRF